MSDGSGPPEEQTLEQSLVLQITLGVAEIRGMAEGSNGMTELTHPDPDVTNLEIFLSEDAKELVREGLDDE